VSSYGHDAAGNIISDSGKGLEIAYNVLNLPRAVSKAGTGKEMLFECLAGLRIIAH